MYLVIETPDGRSTQFVGSKTRVAPVKGHNIPRLELLARLISSLESALSSEIPLMPSMCYTDSKVTLYWIKGENQEWKQFVQNRVNEIQTLVSAQHWKHCSGHDNPADLPSRGISFYWSCRTSQYGSVDQVGCPVQSNLLVVEKS